ncbi:unnamed protein product [Oikopleura dioica]|uniref:RING-type E3 ubiquitin transferase n=1 Tax=Oikopleura dioica TaxID=34765 RepID=E4Y1K9_OIKDI|nr:unnamed protein product [Oikopleura dioica]
MNVECVVCASVHPKGPHVYDFVEDADEDLCCPICLSPFLNPTDLPCCHSFCRACILPYLRKTPQCPQCRKAATVTDCRDSSLSLRRLCDKMAVICPKCPYKTERSLLSDHLTKCRLKSPDENEPGPSSTPLSSPTKHRLKSGNGNEFAYEQNNRGRERSRDRLIPLRWKKSKDRLEHRSRSRDQLDQGGRSKSRDNLNQWRQQARSRSRSVENLAGLEQVHDIAAAIERDIERINIYQESRRTNTDERRRAPQATATVLQQNTYTAPAQRSLVDRSTRQRFGSADNLDQIDSRSTPNLNEAFALETSDDSLGSNHRNYSNMIIQAPPSSPQIDKILDIRVPVTESTGTCGVCIVGGSDTPLRGIVVQHVLPDTVAGKVGLIRSGDRVMKINGRAMDGLNHSEAVTIFAKCCAEVIGREKRELILSLVRQTGYDIEEKHVLTIPKAPNQQVGVKLYNVVDRVVIYDVVPGSLAYHDKRLQVGDYLLKVNNIAVRSSEEAAKEISRLRNHDKINLTISRTARTMNSNSDRPHLIIPDQVTARQYSTVKSKHREKVIVVKKQPGESLGLGVAGGLGSILGDLPVFVLEISRAGILAKDGRVKPGDLIVSINKKKVGSMRHNQVVELLKDIAKKEKEIKLVLCEFDYKHREREENASYRNNIWSPTWRHWLALPPKFIIYRETTIKRQEIQGLGLSIVGGESQPVLVKFCSPGGAAAGAYLRSGDEILAVNGRKITDSNQDEIRDLLSANSVRLTFISWPGCLV